MKVWIQEEEIKMSNGSGFPGLPKYGLTQKTETVGGSSTDRFMGRKYRTLNTNAEAVLKSAMKNDGNTKKS